MQDVIEVAVSSRAKCRGCKKPIAKGEHRFGERYIDPQQDDDTGTLWYHLTCAAEKRPRKLLAVLAKDKQDLPDRKALEAKARDADKSVALERIVGAERAPTGRARCQHCNKTIDKDTWRVIIKRDEQGYENSTASLHAGCASAWAKADGVAAHVLAQSKKLSAPDRKELQALLG